MFDILSSTMAELRPFSAALDRLFTRLGRLHGVGFLWKDADLRLRAAMPRHLVEHLHPRCLATKGSDPARLKRCVAHCRLAADAWDRRRKPARRSTCHGGCCELRVPVRVDGTIVGTAAIGPFRPGRGPADLPVEPTGLEDLAGLLAELIPLLDRERDRERGELDRGDLHPALRSLLRLLREEAGHGDRAADLARRCRISPSRLQHLCREQLGESLGRLRDRALLARAMASLEETDRPVGRVAADLGFADQRYFATWFRRLAGTSPGAWRRERAAITDA